MITGVLGLSSIEPKYSLLKLLLVVDNVMVRFSPSFDSEYSVILNIVKAAPSLSFTTSREVISESKGSGSGFSSSPGASGSVFAPKSGIVSANTLLVLKVPLLALLGTNVTSVPCAESGTLNV